MNISSNDKVMNTSSNDRVMNISSNDKVMNIPSNDKVMNLEEIKVEENFIRDNLYKKEYDRHPMNTNPYYNLIEITEAMWNYICLNILQIKKDLTLYFPNARMELRKRITRSWEDIVKLAKKNKIKYYFGDNADYVFMAGGSVLATLLTVRHQDIDYFATKEIMPHEIKSRYSRFEVTPQIINFDHKRQLIKRLYKVPHEIVHSFDIDCCAVLINRRGRIYGSKRFIYSLINGYNTVDFNYFSPSYEWRLIKYSTRGFSIYVPGIVNCKGAESLYNKTESGICIPDDIWSFADIDDILNGTMLQSLLMNAKGLQKLLIASAVASPDTDYVLEATSEKSMRSSRYMRPPRQSLSLNRLITKQLSDYEEPTEIGNAVSGRIKINNQSYVINGTISYDETGIPITYKGILQKEQNKENRQFSQELEAKILRILLSSYRKVSPGEQTTSTFHKIVLEDPNEWYKLDKSSLFEEALYSLLYFKRISTPPDLYDEKVLWFGPNSINLLIYHIARLVLNNRIYDKFNGFEITQLKVTYGDYIPKSIIYNNTDYPLVKGDMKELLWALLSIGSEHNILSADESNILNALYIRTKEGIVPKLEKRHN
jgi:hypothetical protein